MTCWQEQHPIRSLVTAAGFALFPGITLMILLLAFGSVCIKPTLSTDSHPGCKTRRITVTGETGGYSLILPPGWQIRPSSHMEGETRALLYPECGMDKPDPIIQISILSRNLSGQPARDSQIQEDLAAILMNSPFVSQPDGISLKTSGGKDACICFFHHGVLTDFEAAAYIEYDEAIVIVSFFAATRERYDRYLETYYELVSSCIPLDRFGRDYRLFDS